MFQCNILCYWPYSRRIWRAGRPVSWACGRRRCRARWGVRAGAGAGAARARRPACRCRGSPPVRSPRAARTQIYTFLLLVVCPATKNSSSIRKILIVKPIYYWISDYVGNRFWNWGLIVMKMLYTCKIKNVFSDCE